jgi:signal transduction histidine kinase
MEIAQLAAGTVIFEEGDVAADAYLVESGCVNLTSVKTGGEAGFVAEVKECSLLGEMTVLTERPRTVSAIARTDCTLWHIPGDALRRAVSSDAKLAWDMMRAAMDLVLEKDLSVIINRRHASELRHAVDVERQIASELREHHQRTDERIAIMAHDVRSPLAVIVGCTQILLDRGSRLSDEQRHQLLESISRQAGGLLHLVQDALEVASIETGELKYDIRPLDMAELVRCLLQDLRAGNDTLNVVARGLEQLPEALGDEQRQREILFNLLTNAAKFSPPGQPIEVDVAVDGNSLIVAVSDHGIGIDPEDVRRIFGKFSRVEQPGDGKPTEGFGLGLYICKSLVEAQGGRMWVESTPGEGSTFKYTVPLAS